VKTPAEQRWMA